MSARSTPGLRRTLRRARRRAVPLLLVLAAAGVLVLALAAVLGLRLADLRGDLRGAAASLTDARAALDDADLPRAAAAVDDAARRAAAAREGSTGRLMTTAARLPVVGASLAEVSAVAVALDDTATDVLPGLLRDELRPPRWDGRFDAAPLRALEAPLASSAAALTATRTRLAAAPASGVGPVRDARLELGDALDDLARRLTEAQVAVAVAPALTGADRPHRFLLAVQNNAEPRATGGLLGAYGLLVADGGRLRLETVGANDELVDADRPVLDLGAEFARRYDRFEAARTWRSASLTPDVPTVGRLLSGLWREQTGQEVDGVVLVDPVALSFLLGATGPVTMTDGTRLTRDDAVRFLLSDVYRRFPRAEDAARSTALQEAARRTVAALARPGLDGRAVVGAVARAAATGHLRVWSAEPAVQAQLLRSRAGGALLADGPYLEVVTQDVGGSKLGFWQRRAVTYEGAPTGEAVDLGRGPEAEEEALVTVRLTDTAPAGLPEYVTLRPDDASAPPGRSRTWVSVYLGRRATLLRASLDGAPVAVETGTERGLTVLSLFVDLDRGQTRTIGLRVRQPADRGEPLRYRQQPLVADDELTVRRPAERRPLELVLDPVRRAGTGTGRG